MTLMSARFARSNVEHVCRDVCHPMRLFIPMRHAVGRITLRGQFLLGNVGPLRQATALLRRCPIAPDQQDKRWREQSLRGKLDITYSCARHGVCREFTPVFAKHLRSFWLVDSLAIGVDRMKHNFGPMQKKGEKGEH